MKYAIYKITNNLNQKIYIGAHATRDLNDGYMGSGLHIKRSIAKYGYENFSKEILSIHDTMEEMYSEEARVVNEMFVSRSDTYNMRIGGRGNFHYINSLGLNKPQAKKASESFQRMLKEDPEFKARYTERQRLSHLRNNRWLGKRHKSDSCKLIGEKNKVSQLGTRNSQYGSIWITDGVLSKKIKSDDLIPEGWRKGRKMRV